VLGYAVSSSGRPNPTEINAPWPSRWFLCRISDGRESLFAPMIVLPLPETRMPEPSPAEPVDRPDAPARPLDLEQAAKVLRAAYALCQPGDIPQDVIARLLDVSQSQVSRLLRLARDQRWLVDRPIFVPPERGDAFYELWREVESQFVLSKVLE